VNGGRIREPSAILTTHVGSLPRAQDVVDIVFAEDDGKPVDRPQFDRVIGAAVADRVARQVDSGVDLVSDGEMSKIGYATYVRHRLSGFELDNVPRATPADLDAFPRFRDRQVQSGAGPKYKRAVCRGPITYEHREPLERDLAALSAAVAGRNVRGAFMNAPSPGVIALFLPNQHYASLEDYLSAISAAMRTEYEAIVAAGFTLQIDAPDLAMGRHIMYRDEPDDVFVARIATHIDALEDALREIPAEQVRLHVCWGNYEGPHHFDIGVEKIIGELLRAKPATILFEAANPRHAHEWTVWRDAAVPDDKMLAPGVIDTSTNYIEHPELVAERLGRFVEIVGAERVIAGTDCGFGTWAGFGPIDADICWAKLRTLADGAQLASQRAATRRSRGGP
jgi:5-methyltetrahydropteroyltriglutamate--homocysteine methyltransferase